MSKLNLPILAIETSGELCSASVMLGEKTFYETTIRQKNIHSEKIFEVVEIILSAAKLKIEEIQAIAYSNGPGSFTGLRIGLSAAKGLALGISKPIIPVPTFNALAYSISKYHNYGTKFSIIRNASTDEIYKADYHLDGELVYGTVELINKTDTKKNDSDLIYGDKIEGLNIHEIHEATANQIAEWAYLFGEDLLIFDYDYLEPNYLKKFIVKVKK
ncbi:MAG: tRNA (adenosine(37)-N6)-threonylcarbamoyltransferase complex dimerization subunit type 1 TsaB [Bacteroidota bacterium]